MSGVAKQVIPTQFVRWTTVTPRLNIPNEEETSGTTTNNNNAPLQSVDMITESKFVTSKRRAPDVNDTFGAAKKSCVRYGDHCCKNSSGFS